MFGVSLLDAFFLFVLLIAVVGLTGQALWDLTGHPFGDDWDREREDGKR